MRKCAWTLLLLIVLTGAVGLAAGADATLQDDPAGSGATIRLNLSDEAPALAPAANQPGPGGPGGRGWEGPDNFQIIGIVMLLGVLLFIPRHHH